MIKKSKVKAKLARNEPATLVWLHLTDPSIFELTSLMGWDGIMMDLEHHGHSVETAQHLIRAARVGGADIVARPAKGEFMRIGRLLESGARGILYPRCESAAEAAEVVKWAKFAPVGKRGVDAAGADNPFLLTPIDKYIQSANEQTLIVVQIEELGVAEHAQEIARVDGVDALMVGPGDMSVLAGIAGQYQHPLILRAIQQVADAAASTGKHWGAPAGSPDQVKSLMDMGARFISYGVDLVAIKSWLEQSMQQLTSLGFRFDGDGF